YLDGATLERTRPDGDPQRVPDQIGVFEFHPRTLLAVVEQHVDAARFELIVQPDRGRPQSLVAPVDRHDDDVERRERHRPNDAGVVVVLLDRGGDRPRHADAVTAHLEDALRALGVEHRRVHRRAVLRPELKHLPDLDAALKNGASAAARTGIALAGDAQVGEFYVGEIARLHHADEMLISLVRASDAVGEPGERAIGDTAEAGLQADRAGEADGRAGDARDDVL